MKDKQNQLCVTQIWAALFTGVSCTAFILLIPVASAETLYINPIGIDSSAPVEQALKENAGRASMKLEGEGSTMKLAYQSSEKLTVYMVPLSESEGFVPTDFLMLTLPATSEGLAEIDLTVSPGWTTKKTTWLLHLMTKNKDAKAGFMSVEFLPAGPKTSIQAAFRHFFRTEPYIPSSYHSLRGYRVLSKDMTLILGLLLIVTSVIAVLIAKKESKLAILIVVLCTFQAVYGLRFGLDLLRFSSEHLTGYAEGIYDEAGSVYQIAPMLHSLAAQQKKEVPTSVFICRSGTNYKEKILRYFAYPIRISADATHASMSDYVLVMNARDWNIQTIAEENISKQVLQCADLRFEVNQIASFPDGSILFSHIK